MSIAYHWTTLENAKKISSEGLLPNSWVCIDIEDWQGDVCFEVECDVDWEDKTKSCWRRQLPKGAKANKMRLIL